MNHVDDLFNVFEIISNKEKSAEMRLTVIALLDDIIKFFGSYSYKVLTILILPNIEWEVGSIASAVRKAAILCFFNLLYHNTENSDVSNSIKELYSKLISPLLSCLDDDDKTIRLITSQSLLYFFKILKNSLSDEQISKIYGDLIKRLDDSENNIRISCCNYLIEFFKCGDEKYYRGTLFKYCLDWYLL